MNNRACFMKEIVVSGKNDTPCSGDIELVPMDMGYLCLCEAHRSLDKKDILTFFLEEMASNPPVVIK